MAQMLNELTNKQFEEMYQAARNKWYTDKEFFDIMLKNWYVTQDAYNTLDFDEQWNATQKAVEETPATDIPETPEQTDESSENFSTWRTFDDVINSSWWDDAMSSTARNAIVNYKANKELLQSAMKNTKLGNKLKEVTKKVIAKADKNLPASLYWGKAGSIPFSELPKATQKALLKRFAWNFLMWAITAAWTIVETNQNNNKALTRSDWNWFENWLYSLLDAIDNATEWAPILSLVDLVWDAAWWAAWKDENWESYAQWWLLTKLVNIWEEALWVDNWARTFWQNTPEQQLKDLEAKEWMEDQWFKWKRWWSKKWLKAEEWSKADVALKNDKAIDKIQGNTAGRWEAATDWVSADREQQNKRDANLYISWKNRADGKNLDDTKAYSYNNFTKDFYAKDDWTWVNKKTWETAWQMWAKEKKRAEDNWFKVK